MATDTPSPPNRPLRMHALWWWIDRWRKSTAFTDMTLEQQGAYRNLLDECWLRGGAIPRDERILARAAGDAVLWPQLREVVMKHFVAAEDGWRNTTLDEVMRQSTRRATNQHNYRERQRQKAEATQRAPHSQNNGTDNGTDNGRNNIIRHPRANNRHNKPASPDPDPDPDHVSGSGARRARRNNEVDRTTRAARR